MANNRNYWRKRFELIADEQYEMSAEYADEIEELYNRTIAQIEKDINNWYARFASENGITVSEAKKLLDKKELQEFHWTVEEYIQKGKENAVDGRWVKELENASIRVHITRLDSLKMQMQHHIELLTAKFADSFVHHLTKVYSEGFYKSIFEIQKGTGISHNFAKLDTNLVEKYLSKPWAKDGRNFSERVWGIHRPKLVETLKKDLTQSVIKGEDPQKLINKIAKDFNTSKSAAGRLVMTESAAYNSLSTLDGFKEIDVEEYEISAAFDMTTCEQCGNLDGQHFKIDKYSVGSTAPPFHCNCRCTTVPYFNDMGDITIHFARGKDGKGYEVNGDMTYNEWKSKYVDNNNTSNTKKAENDVAKVNRNDIIRVDKAKLREKPNSITEVVHKKGGIERNYYDSEGKQIKQICNNNHGKPKAHPFGKNGEHAHDYIWKDGELIGRPARELTDIEREENSDII